MIHILEKLRIYPIRYHPTPTARSAARARIHGGAGQPPIYLLHLLQSAFFPYFIDDSVQEMVQEMRRR